MHLGVCYYPEHWPESQWADDAARMWALGIRQVRIAEFCWSRIEPRAGVFDFAWLDRALAVLASAGLQIVMCTPSATPPKWLVDADPDMLAVGADGRRRAFGSRRHYDFSSDTYLAQACRITQALGQRYGQHPAVVAWQIDNEYGCHDTVISHSSNAVRRFRHWLRQRYGSVRALNTAWGNVFWSMEVGSFDEVDSPAGTVTEANPSQRLDYQRFASDEVQRFNRAQCSILRTLSPGRALVHNFMQLFTGFDARGVAADLDVASWDSYPLGALEMFWFSAADKARWLRTGHPDLAAFHHDWYRGMSRQPFWVMEQQPGPVNWAHWNPAPALGMVRLWSWEAFAHGADVVSYFRWRQAPFGQEQMHAGLLAPDSLLDVGGHEAAQVAQELGQVPAMAVQRARVALVFDAASRWLFEVQPQGADYDALRLAFEAYSALRSLGLDIDIVGSDDALQGYALVVLPAQPMVSVALVAALQASTAQVVLYPRAGSKTATLHIEPGLPPGPLRALIDVRIARVESLRPGVTERVVFERRAFVAERWRESVEAGPTVTAEARFADGTPAVLKQGRVRYLAGWFDAGLQQALLHRAALDAGLSPVQLPPGLRLRRRGELLFVFNYASAVHEVQVPQAQWLVGGATVHAHGVAIARHQP